MRHIIVNPILVALITTVSSAAWAADSRTKSVNEEMDCVIAAFNRQEKMSWSDVCYTEERKTGPSGYVQKEVDKELDYYESDYDYGRESEYQSSLEYLQNFMTETSGRRVAVEEPWYDQPKAVERAELPRYEDYHPMPSYVYDHSSFDNDSGLEPKKEIKTKVDVGIGYRDDSLDWSISGDFSGNNPNVFAEYVFDDLRSVELEGEAEVLIRDHFVLDGSASYGRILNGNNQVSEYDLDDRQGLAVRTSNSADEDIVWDISGGVGFRVGIGKEDAVTEILDLKDVEVTVLAGYARHDLDLNIKDGHTIVDNTATPELGPFAGLDSSYNAEWKGPWVGAELSGKVDRITASFRVEYHLADYYGWGRLNLRPEFQQPKSFEHMSEGTGWILDFNLAYQLTKNFCVDFNGGIQMWQADAGIDRLFLADGTIAEESQLNEVNWDSHAFMVGGTYTFD